MENNNSSEIEIINKTYMMLDSVWETIEQTDRMSYILRQKLSHCVRRVVGKWYSDGMGGQYAMMPATNDYDIGAKFELMYDDGSGDAYLWDAFTSEESAAWALAGLVSNGVTYRDFK